MNKNDDQLKQDVEAELRWDPKVNAAQIGVTVDQGTVSLLGTVDTYAEKWAAEDATKRVSGVRTVAQDLTVKLLEKHVRNDSELAAAVLSALQWNVYIPKTITAKVEGARVTLEGHATWNFQRDAAEHVVRELAGVTSVSNFIDLRPDASAAQVKEKVEAALKRQAVADAKSIHIETSGNKVTLTGDASSWQSTRNATNAAWSAPGVREVVDHVRVSVLARRRRPGVDFAKALSPTSGGRQGRFVRALMRPLEASWGRAARFARRPSGPSDQGARTRDWRRCRRDASSKNKPPTIAKPSPASAARLAGGTGPRGRRASRVRCGGAVADSKLRVRTRATRSR